MSALSIDTLKERCRLIHGDKYDYDWSTYVKTHDNMRMICHEIDPLTNKEHGEFWMSLHMHFSKRAPQGCPKCSGNHRWSFDEFVERANIIHNNKYKYDRDTYVTGKIKTRITCHEVDPLTGKEHGDFWMAPHDHTCGKQACPKCVGRHVWTREEVIERANAVHNNKYDYSEFKYHGMSTPCVIICHEKDENGVEHGRFMQAPANHISKKQGCPKCADENRLGRGLLTPQEIVEKAKTVHGDRYTYTTDFVYTGNKCKMPIICKEHGLFYQRVNDNLMGRGCPECGKTFVQERLLFEEVQKRYSDTERYHKEEFLHSATSYQTIDVYIPSLRVGIEYQGEQHFTERSFYSKDGRFEKTKERDLRKYNKCLEHGIKIFYFSKEPKRLIPDDYIDTVYTEYEDLFSAISLYANNRG